MSLEMLRAARSAGVTRIVCTPHCRDPYFDYERMRASFALLREHAGGFPLTMGFEVAYPKLMELGIEQWARKLCFEGSNEFLLELDPRCIERDFIDYERAIVQLQGMGMSVVIAHPERYRAIQENIDLAERLVDMGCLLQASSDFMAGGRLRLLIIVGTRPEVIRLSEVIKKCRRHFDCLLAHTGQNYDYNLNGIFFRDLSLDDPDVYMDAVGDGLGETMGNIIARSYDLMNAVKPEALLILGDTNSCLSAIAAKRLHIPIFHMEAGNRCKDECLPEETNRRIVDIISDVNLAYSEHARRYLAECGLPRERTYVTGSPMAEVLRANLDQILASDVHGRLGLEPGKYMLLSAHREENIDTQANFESLFNAINKLAEIYQMPILYSCHPRSRKRLESTGFKLHPLVRMHEPMGFHDYNRLQSSAFCVVSDSGTLPEESSFFASVGMPFPAVCIRTSTERPEALDKACFTLAGIDERGLVNAVRTAVALDEEDSLPQAPVPDYADESVSTKVVKIVQSYTGIVDKMVWRKR